MSSDVIPGPDGPIEVHRRGQGRPVVLLPSLGRGATDFDDLAGRLAHAGHLTLCPEPRGIGASAGPTETLSLADQAADVAAVIRHYSSGPATVVGHAYGNRIARMLATREPEVIESLVLLACGGMVPAEPEAGEAILRVFDPTLSDDEHLDAVRIAFFAPGNDPAVWFDGWYGVVAAVQAKATAETDVGEWWTAGRADVLVVQPEQDAMAPVGNAAALAEQLGERATVLSLSNAGHALLPEQPEEVARLLVDWLDLRGAR